MQKETGRFEITVDGKWQGGTFATQNEADAAADKLRATSKGQSVAVRQRKALPVEPQIVTGAVAAPAPAKDERSFAKR